MSYINIILVILIIMAVLLFFLKGRKKTAKKPAFMKKDEIIEAYKQQMQTVIQTYQNDAIQLKEKKISLIKKINQELNKNIFFNQEEIKKIIYELTVM
ncbi:MAG: hypothetical protein WCY75_00445 [Sulfurimonadaceae bacterium]